MAASLGLANMRKSLRKLGWGLGCCLLNLHKDKLDQLLERLCRRMLDPPMAKRSRNTKGPGGNCPHVYRFGKHIRPYKEAVELGDSFIHATQRLRSPLEHCCAIAAASRSSSRSNHSLTPRPSHTICWRRKQCHRRCGMKHQKYGTAKETLSWFSILAREPLRSS